MKKSKNTPVYIAAFALFLAGFGFLFYSSFSDGSISVFSVAQARGLPSEQLQAVRLFGTVADYPAPRSAGPRGVSFYLTDENNENLMLFVNFGGIVPDTFKPGVEVFIEGSMQQTPKGDVPHFIAGSLRTKCPSKYEKENRT